MCEISILRDKFAWRGDWAWLWRWPINPWERHRWRTNPFGERAKCTPKLTILPVTRVLVPREFLKSLWLLFSYLDLASRSLTARIRFIGPRRLRKFRNQLNSRCRVFSFFYIYYVERYGDAHEQKTRIIKAVTILFAHRSKMNKRLRILING